MPKQHQRIAVIGADSDVEVRLRLWRTIRGARVVAVAAQDLATAERLVERMPGVRAFATAYETLRIGGIDLVHVCGPVTQRAANARLALEHGVACLVMNPPGLAVADAEALLELASARGLALRVESAWCAHPRVAALAKALAKGTLGRLEALQIVSRTPVPPGAQAESPVLALAAAAEPLLLAATLLGPISRRSGPAPAATPAAPRLTFDLECARGQAQVHVCLGGSTPEAQVLALCSDAVVRLDLQRDVVQKTAPTSWPDALEHAQNGALAGARMIGQAGLNFAGACLAGLRLTTPRHGMTRGLRGSLEQALRADRPTLGDELSSVVASLEARATGISAPREHRFEPPPPLPPRPGEIVVAGTLDAIGRALVTLLLEKGQPTTLLVPRPEALPRELRDPRARVFALCAGDAASARKALHGAAFVVVLGTTELGEPADVAVERLAKLAFDQRVTRFLLVSSAATLPLGARVTLQGSAEPDALALVRAPAVRAWIRAERALRDYARLVGLDTVTLRPGLVVGGDEEARHPGLGRWVRGTVCVGYGMGHHPLPFVLASDVARAILGALFTKGIAGRSYNLAGDVRLTAQEYVGALARRTQRAYRFRPQPLLASEGASTALELVAFALRRHSAAPTPHELRARAFLARLDCDDAKRDLGWWPCADRERFLIEAIAEQLEGARG